MANQSCIVPGGVESVLKWNKIHKHNNNSSGKGSSMDDLAMNLESSVSLEHETISGGEYNSASVNSNSNHEPSVNSSAGSGGNKKFGKLFKSGLKKAQASITHSVTSIAIKADGGKNPDWICASLHYLGGRNGGGDLNRKMSLAIGTGGNSVSDVCLGKTEWIPLPSPSSFGGGDLQHEQQQLSFAVPLSVPDLSFLESTAADNGIVLTVRLYLRSGATLLKASAIKKEYCIGECSLMYSQLGVGKSSDANVGQYRAMNLQFTNGMLADPSSYMYNSNPDSPPMLNLMALPRVKFSPPCRVGWSYRIRHPYLLRQRLHYNG